MLFLFCSFFRGFKGHFKYTIMLYVKLFSPI
ncbi:MAG: hypothetical protein ACI849_001837, partial [Patiriisocius sp.]